MTSKDFTNKDLAATQESLHTTQNSLSDCFNEVAVVRSDLERNVADTEARLKNDIRQKQHLGHRFAPSLEINSCTRCQSEQSVGCMKPCPTSKAGGLREDRCGGTAGRPLACLEHVCPLSLQAELRSAEASRRLGALDLRMSGVQGGLGEHKRDILKLREAGFPEPTKQSKGL